MITGVAAKQNPFPGLRPFREDEEHFFFGRESQIDTMVNKLAATRFLAVVGTSGSGKSSLVNCGLRPALHRGLMASAGSAWRMAQFRPGVNPIQSLACALAANGVLYSGYKEDVPIEEIVETYLHQSEKGVVKTFRKARLPEGTNLLVVVDQFEELFRYRKLGTPDGEEHYISEAAIAFVNLLLKASAEPDCPIYVVITMRSDFLGDCSQFYGLPEAINEGQYLVPRMTRDERRASIAGPVSVGGAEINPVLLTRLVNDVGDNPDQLSILQHALNRTWACWEFHGAEGELDLQHYTAIGTMGEALNQHADEAFKQLATPESAKICEKLFKALTDLGTDPRGIRRPLKLATLSEIAGTGSEEEVKAVIEVFREPSRSFLMPPAPEPLQPEKVIDISHESLMRVWEQLRRWAEEEANSARRYRRLAETAALEKTGKARLWRDPDLQLALDWQEEQAPTPAWANLYGGDFESAIAFLEKSRYERDHELAQVDFERRWSRIRFVIVIILLIAGFALWRFMAGDLESWWAQWRFSRWRFLRDIMTTENTVILALTSFLGLYFLGYFALAYFGKWIFRRLVFAKILQEVALSSRKAVREQTLLDQSLGDRAVTLGQMTYASFWRRLGAYVLDLGLFTVGLVAFFVGLRTCGRYAFEFLDFLESLVHNLSLGVLLIPFVVDWLYQVMMLRSRHQATLGMRALGIFVIDEKAYRLNFAKATARHFAKLLSYITLGIGFLVQPFTRRRQTLHDMIVRSVVFVRPGKKRVPKWIVTLCVIIGLVEAAPLVVFPVLAGLKTQSQAQSIRQTIEGYQKHAAADEAKAAGKTTADFPQVTADIFKPMDGGIDLSPEEIMGRNTWNLWSAGNQHFWNRAAQDSYGLMDLLKMLDSRKFSRGERFKMLGLVNEPGFRAPTKPDEFGLWLDEQVEPEPAGIDETVYGKPSGILGFRLFPNPDFNQEARKRWNGDRFMNDPTYYNDNKLVRPYRVGVACGSCHIAPNPSNPPDDPENPRWENLASAIGNQYINEGKVFACNVEKGGFFYEMFAAQPRGTSDISRIATDQINNPSAINAIFLLAERERIAASQKMAGGTLALPGEKEEMAVPLILKDGADSVGVAGANLRAYVNIGMFSEYWLTLHNRLIGLTPQKPFEIPYAREHSVFWRATEERLANIAAFFRRLKPFHLADAPGGQDYITRDAAVMARGKGVFAESCAECHSSKQPSPNTDPTSGERIAWFRAAVGAPDFLENNLLSDGRWYPLTKIGTNSARAFATNAKAGHVWDNFSSQTYKELSPIDELEFFNPFDAANPIKFKPKAKNTGPGYYRVPSLVSLWSSAPFLHNNALGKITNDPSVAGRMEAFNDAVEKLLWPEKRLNKDSIRRTYNECSLYLRTESVPKPLRALANSDGYIQIGPIPKGTPVNLIANLEPDFGQLAVLPAKITKALLKIRAMNLSSEQANAELIKSVPELLTANKCPDFIEDKGHYFGTDLSDADKRALIEYLKTF